MGAWCTQLRSGTRAAESEIQNRMNEVAVQHHHLSCNSQCLIQVCLSLISRMYLFSGWTFAEIQKDISLLTVVLKRRRDRLVTSTSTKRSLDRLKQMFSHISTLVTIGTPEDRSSGKANAVTGYIEKDIIVSAILTQKTQTGTRTMWWILQSVSWIQTEGGITYWPIGRQSD